MQKEYTINEILSNEQFKIKLNYRYYLASGTNFLFFILSYFTIESFINFIAIFALLSLIGYRFLFSYTKDGNQFKPYFIRKVCMVIKKIRSRKNIK
ncbi:hypothetical protein [Campylobacter sp. US33a]|uniref:hypothetical protein n=1 Tax=Campylobacter sp. US33a TaxID=2498120 RepID=UPI00106736C8|nr:hypothetical protein [Campylobacter sp. US33a]TEY00731.1 hypothetical protein ELQ16_08840 [Campylobacter sp. US33a]